MRRLDRLARLALALLGAVMAAAYMRSNSYDDAFITLRHSLNLIKGHGLVYNVGETFLGTSAPGFAVLIALLSWPWPEYLPNIANAVSGVGLISSGLALFEYSRMHGAPLVGLLAGALLVTCLLALQTVGGEMLVQLALVLWAFVALARSRTFWTSLLVGLACVVRPDAALAAVAAFGVMWATKRTAPLREIAIFLVLVVPVYSLIWIEYGSPIPGSVIAKSYQRDIGLWRDFTRDAPYLLVTRMVPQDASASSRPRISASYAVVGTTLILGTLQLLMRRRFWLTIFCWPSLVVAMYLITNPPAYHWYLVPILWPLLVIFACGVEASIGLTIGILRHLLEKRFPEWTPMVVKLAFLSLLIPTLLHLSVNSVKASIPSRVPYREIAFWLKSNAPGKHSIAHYEIGYLGYELSDWFVIDPLGLVHPGVSQRVAQGNGYAVLQTYDPSVVLYAGPFLGTDLEADMAFRASYTRVASVKGNEADPTGDIKFYDVYMEADMARNLGLGPAPSVRTRQQQLAIESAQGR